MVKMKTKQLNIFSFLISLFLFISPALALPCAFYGQVTLDGSPINGTNVDAYLMNGTFISKGKEPIAGFGHYSIAVNAPGENVTLKINGIVIDQGIKLCENGNLYSINISATSPPTTVPTTTIQYGGGGGGGGHSVTTTINTTKKTNTTTAVTTIATTIPSNDNSNVETKTPVTTESPETVQNAFDITGLFLNGIASLGYWSILIVIIIIWAIAALIWRMRSNKKESKETSEDESPKEDTTIEKESEEAPKEDVNTEETPNKDTTQEDNTTSEEESE